MIQAELASGEILCRGDNAGVQQLFRIGARRKTRSRGGDTFLPLNVESICALRSCGAQMTGDLAAQGTRLEKIQRYLENTKTAQHVNPLKDVPIKAPYTLYQHQIKAFNIALALKSFAAFMDMGTGKSLTTVAIAGRRYLDGTVKRLLIVAPSSVCAVWPREFKQFADFPARVQVLLGEMGKRKSALHYLMAPVPRGEVDPLRVAVINYEATWRMDEDKQLSNFAPDMIVCDESQRIKNPRAKQSKAMHTLGDLKSVKYKMILTGTPIQNNTLDLWSQYRFLAPQTFDASFYAYQHKYAVMGGIGNHQYFGPRNLEELTRKAHAIAYRVTKEECLDLPEKVFEDRPVDIGDKAMKLYKALARDSCAALEGAQITANIVLTRLLRLQQVTGGHVNDDNGNVTHVHNAKVDACAEIVESLCIDDNKKVVLFARFRPELSALHERIGAMLEKRKLSYVAIDGSVSVEKRGALVEKFQTDPDCRVFIGQIEACAEGITLTAASTMVYYSYTFNSAKYLQSLDRIHRVGQVNRCTYIHLIVPDSIDEHILKALKNKEDLARSVTDNWQKYFGDDAPGE